MPRLREFVLLDPTTDRTTVLHASSARDLAHRLRGWDRSAFPSCVPLAWESAYLAALLLWNGRPVYLDDSEVTWAPGSVPLRRVAA